MDRPAQWLYRLLVLWNGIVFLAWVAVPFLLARDPMWGRGWAHLALLAALLTAHRAVVARRNPALFERRRRIGAGTATWDLWWNAAFWPLMAAIAAVAGAEARCGSALPGLTSAAGAVLLSGGIGLSAAAMASNPFFEGTVRIQTEAGHRTIDTGPYRVIRHPGYAGLVLWALATPLLLGSARAFLPALAAIAWVVLRTALEDATLRRGLQGYFEYSRCVRFRLVPWVW